MKRLLAILLLSVLVGFSIGIALGQDDGDWDHRGPDGHYHNPNTGEVMDDKCPSEHHPCNCARMNERENDCFGKKQADPGNKCRTYCRKDDCTCKPTCCSEHS